MLKMVSLNDLEWRNDCLCALSTVAELIVLFCIVCCAYFNAAFSDLRYEALQFECHGFYGH